jgi:hypothetical protein
VRGRPQYLFPDGECKPHSLLWRLYIHFILWIIAHMALDLFPVTYPFVVKECYMRCLSVWISPRGEQTRGNRTGIIEGSCMAKEQQVSLGNYDCLQSTDFVILYGGHRKEEKRWKREYGLP